MPQSSVTIRIENALGQSVRTVEVSARIDPDTLFLLLPPAIVLKLGLASRNRYRSIQTTEGPMRCRYVGPVTLLVGEARAFGAAVECGDEVVLGSIPLTELALMIDPTTGELTADPRPLRIGTVFMQPEESIAL